MPTPTISSLIERFGSRLRFPQLFWAVAILFLVDLVVPDMIPFFDEILFGLLTLLLGSLKKEDGGGGADDGPRQVKNVTPRD